ncbi:MAG: enoyl-CoA hydratase/isomerase family protein [Acidimicrobiales bacterium]|nr:enoyl-CoA hydratase/isomerase family protein [Acidimicrobiales bacterium]
MEWATLEVRREGSVGWIIFDRPDAGNAIDASMFTELERAWSTMEADDEVKVIVNTGNGRAFQTGLDVVQLAQDREALRESSRRTRNFTLRMTGWHCGVTKPVIAAVNGTCAGGGLHFVADADLVIAAEGATFLDPHVSVGQVSAFETTGLLKKAPAEAVLRMAVLGREERMSAPRAHQLGIVGEVVPDAELRARAGSMAEALAAEPADALAAVKAAAWARLESP